MTRNHVADIASHFGMSIPHDWQGIDAVLPLLEKMRAEGAVVTVKLDGERGPGDNGPYTVAVSAGRLPPASGIRVDSETIEDALAYVISVYASRLWGIPTPV